MKDKTGSSLKGCKKMLNMSKMFVRRNKTISHNTINKYVLSTDWGKISYKMKKPMITKLNAQQRLNFGKMVSEHGYCDGSHRGERLRQNVLWTDESPIELYPTPNLQNTRIRTLDKSKTIIK